MQVSSDAVFEALGDPTRRAIVERLSRGPASVSALAEPLGVTLAAVLQHVQVLQDAELVTSRKVGRVRTCSLDVTGLSRAAAWLDDRRRTMERKLDRLGEVLDEAPGEGPVAVPTEPIGAPAVSALGDDQPA